MGRSQAADSRADTCDVEDDGECGGLVHRLHHGLSGAVSVALPLLREKAVPVASGGKHSFAAFRSGTMIDYGRLYYQVSFRLWQFCWGCGVRPGIWNGGRVHGDGFGLEQARRGCWLLPPPAMKESEP